MRSDTTLGEALLARLATLFQQDPLIDEVGLLFSTEANDLAPETAFFLEEHKLGVAFAAGIPLFQAARSQFRSLNAQLQQDAAELDTERRAQLLHCTRAILLINADFYTAWNTRKAFVARGWLEVTDEVQFTNLVFTLQPKSIDTWAYRRWLAIRVCTSHSGDDLKVFFKQQVAACGRLAELKARNYHAWSFRHWIVSRMTLELLLEELVEMDQWCKSHVMDHSGWNHRQHIVNELTKRHQDANDSKANRDMILAEYKFASDIMASFTAHESLWCHRRYVAQRLLGIIAQDKSFNDAPIPLDVQPLPQATPDSDLDMTKLLTVSWNEIHSMLSDDSGCSSLIRAILLEIDLAWKCGTKFSRRYSVWCLALLRGLVGGDENNALANELEPLASTYHAHLIKEDAVLEDFWRRA